MSGEESIGSQGSDETTGSPEQQSPDAASRNRLRVATTVLALVAIAAAFLLGSRLAAPGTPSDLSAEAGFARDMQTHHSQAVEMALIVRDKTSDPTLRAVTYDIITSQQQQSGQLYGWLTQWRLPQTSRQPAMAWMAASAAGGHDMGSMPAGATMPPGRTPGPDGRMLGLDGRMPGMASAADLARLQSSQKVEAEILFLRLMITHHQAGVAMARAIQPLTDRPEVLALADAIAQAQTAEIDQLRALLAARGE